MKRKALAIVLTLLMLVSVLPMGAFAASYTDTEGHWAEKAIDQWTEAKVLEGMGDNLYAPDDNLTRAQAMTIFSRLLKLTEKADISKLTDVTENDWFYPYVQTGYVYDITKGTSDTEFNPNGFITRQEFFTMFARAVGMKAAATANKDFSDLDTMSDWAKTEGMVYSMINNGYLNGYPDGTLKPLQNITRAEVAAVLSQTIGMYITEDGTYDLTGVNGIVIVTAPNVKLTGDFNGLIVSSAPNAKLDLSGIKGTPRIHVLQPDATITGAPVGTEVTTGPVATNPTVNGVKRSNNDDYIVPGAGGGGGGSTSRTYVAELKFDVPNGLTSKDPDLLVTVNSRMTAADVLRALGEQAAESTALTSAIDSKLPLNYDKDGTVVDITEDGVITVTIDGVPKNVGEKLEKASNAYLNSELVKDVRAQLTDGADAWDAFVADMNPANMFEKVSATAVKLDASNYAACIGDALNDLADLVEAEGDDFDYDALLKMVIGTNGTFGMNNWVKNPDAVATMIDKDADIQTPDDALYYLDMFAAFNDDSDIVQAVLKAAIEGDGDSSLSIKGNYNLNFNVHTQR